MKNNYKAKNNTNMQEKKNSFTPWFSDGYEGPEFRNSKVKNYLSLTPQYIKNELDKYVVNQDEACQKIAVMMYQHLHGHRFVGLLAGPTGSGKSFIAECLKETFPDLVYIRDVSNLTCDGWNGDKKVSTLFRGVHNPYSYNGVIYPLIFLDECDKMFAPHTSSAGENVSESVQSELLTVIHGGKVEFRESSENYQGKNKLVTVDTSNMSFLFAGAFEKRALQIADEESGPSIGFGSSHEKKKSYDRDLTMEDVRRAGCMSEMCGRIQKLVCLNKLDEDVFREMLNIKNKGPVYEMEKEFNIPILISDKKKDEIAHNAYVSGLGIRGMKNAIRDYIDELTWEDCHAKALEIV